MKKTLLFTLFILLILTGCQKEIQHPCNETHLKERPTVSYLGPEGTYTEEATLLYFEDEATLLPLKTVDLAIEALKNGESDYAVIPQENTLGGPVYNYIDALIQSDVSIVAEIELPIRQALLVKDGTTLEDIDTVYSHAQGIIQGSAWLNKNLEKAEVIEVSSTAEGAKMVMESAQNNVAAIASEMAAKVYGLEVFASNIQENEDNQTRFFVLSNNEACKSEHERMVFMAKGDAKDLNDLLSKIDQQNLELIYLHDRPLQTELGEYIYLIECTKGDYEDYLEITTLKSFEFKYYGTFSVY